MSSKSDLFGFLLFGSMSLGCGGACAFSGDAFFGVFGLGEAILSINFLDMHLMRWGHADQH